MRRLAVRFAVELWLPALLIAGWWQLSAQSTSLFFPPLGTILERFQVLWLFDKVPTDVLPSLRNLALGLALGAVLGILLGMVLGLWSDAHDAVLPVLEFMRAIPGVVLLPAAFIVFGFGVPMKVMVITYGTLWPILLNTIDGVRGVDPLVRDMARSYHLGRWDWLVRVILPAASPQIVAGMRVSVSLGVVLIVASEYIAATEGIGYIQLQSERTYALPEMWSALLLLGIIGYACNIAFRVLEHRLLYWHRGFHGGELD